MNERRGGRRWEGGKDERSVEGERKRGNDRGEAGCDATTHNDDDFARRLHSLLAQNQTRGRNESGAGHRQGGKIASAKSERERAREEEAGERIEGERRSKWRNVR